MNTIKLESFVFTHPTVMLEMSEDEINHLYANTSTSKAVNVFGDFIQALKRLRGDEQS